MRPESQHRETEGRQSGAERGDVAEARGYETASRNTEQEGAIESQHRETEGRQSGAERGDVAEAREYETASRNTGQEAEVEDAAEMPEYEANNVRFSIVSDRAELARLEEDLKQNGYEVRYRVMVKVSDEAAEEDYDAGPATFEESVTGGLLKAASRTSAALSARVTATRALGGN